MRSIPCKPPKAARSEAKPSEVRFWRLKAARSEAKPSEVRFGRPKAARSEP